MYLGIDLGTSNSSIAGMQNSVPRVFKTPDGADYLPSAIYIDRRGNRLYGERAYAQTFMSPDNVATGFKRLMGTKTNFEFSASGQVLTAEDCSAEILRQLVGQAFTESGTHEITGAVVTIPAAFNQMQCESTINAARKAGMERVALLQEPIAASMAAMTQGSIKSGQFLVYDMGGGTFDLALVQSVSGEVNVLAHEGINMLGGRDFDKAILNSIVRPWLLDTFSLPQDFQRIPAYRRLMRVAAYAVEKAKIGLTTSQNDVIHASEEEMRVQDDSGQDMYLQIDLTRSELEGLLHKQIDPTIELSRKIMKDNGYSHDDIDRLVFIGGPTKMPLIREYVPRELGIPADLETNPMTAVAIGAAIYSESRNWDVGGTTRKASRGSVKTKGDLQLSLDYPARTSSDSARIKVTVQKDELGIGSELEFTTGTGWTSGRARLENGMIVDVPLDDLGENIIRMHVFDSTGRPIEDASETLVITKVQASTAGIPATQTIAVKVVDDMNSNRNALEPLVEKGRLLPASGTKSFRAARSLKAGDHDYLEFALFQDEGVPEVHLNLCVGSFRISGNDLPDGMAVKLGDEIDIRWFMSDSGLLQASIELPSLGQAFETPKFYSPQSGHQSFSVEEGTQIAKEAIEEARKELDSAEEAIGTSIQQKAREIREMLADQMVNLDNAASGEDTRSVTETVRHIRQDISRLRHAAAHQKLVQAQELTRLQAGFNQTVRKQADERLVAEFDRHSMNAQRALARGDERAMREVEQHLDAMHSIYLKHLLQDPRFLTAVFQHRSQRRFLATDPPEFDRLIAQGQKAIEMEDIDTLRNVIFRIDENLMTPVATDADLTDLASLMKW